MLSYVWFLVLAGFFLWHVLFSKLHLHSIPYHYIIINILELMEEAYATQGVGVGGCNCLQGREKE